MASAFQSNAFQNNAFQIDGVTPPPPTDYNPSNLDGHVRMYGGAGGGVYRVSDADVDAMLKLLFRVRKKKRRHKEKAKEFEDAAMLLLNAEAPEVKRIIVDSAGPLLAGRTRQADLSTLVQAMLQRAADEAALAQAAFEEDEEDVMLLLGAM